jgi:hypothetical protein
MNLFCSNCSRGRGGLGDALQATSHKCGTCTMETYTAFVICVCCAVENSKCQKCGGDVSPALDDMSGALIIQARESFDMNVATANKHFDVQLADIRDDIESWLRVNKEAGAKYEAAFAANSNDYEGPRDEMFATINAERDRIGSEKLARYEHAFRARDLKIRRAARRFELVAERICGHREVDRRYAEELANLNA